MTFGERPTLGHLSHFGNSNHQVIEGVVAVTPLSIPVSHTRQQCNSLCTTLGQCPAKRFDQSGPKSIAFVSCLTHTHFSNVIRCFPLWANVPLKGLTSRVQNQLHSCPYTREGTLKISYGFENIYLSFRTP